MNDTLKEDGTVISLAYDLTIPFPKPDNESATGLMLDKSTLNLVEGTTGTLTATITPTNVINKTVIFESDNEAVATVTGAHYNESTGTTSVIVNAIAQGTATITATTTDENKTATCVVVVDSNFDEDGGYTVTTEFNLSKLEANQMVTAKVTAKNNNSDITKTLVIVGLYEGEKMINVSYLSKDIPIGFSESLLAGFKLPPIITSQHHVKVFVWDGDSIDSSNCIPLSKVTYMTRSF